MLCMCAVWYAHMYYCAARFENERFFSFLTETERETSFASEQVWYYGFFKKVLCTGLACACVHIIMSGLSQRGTNPWLP